VRKGSWMLAVLGVTLWVAGAPRAQSPQAPKDAQDLEMVQKLLLLRKDYQKTLEQLRAQYLQTGDLERAKWAEEELRQWHRISRHAFRLDLDVPPPNLTGDVNVPEANKLYARAFGYKDKGFGNDYLDNQRRSEILFQDLLTRYPQSDKISDTAFMLGDIYESKAYKQYRRSAAYFERCFQWNAKTHFDARLRAARIYDRQLNERQKAIELYREVVNRETDQKRTGEAERRISELSGAPRAK
jgi:TolA-binding protein